MLLEIVPVIFKTKFFNFIDTCDFTRDFWVRCFLSYKENCVIIVHTYDVYLDLKRSIDMP